MRNLVYIFLVVVFPLQGQYYIRDNGEHVINYGSFVKSTDDDVPTSPSINDPVYPILSTYADSVWGNNFEDITSGYTANHYLTFHDAGDSVINYFDIGGEGLRSWGWGIDQGDPYDPRMSLVSMEDSTGGEITGTNAIQIWQPDGVTGGPTGGGIAFEAIIPAGYRELYLGYRMIWRIVDPPYYIYDPLEDKIPHFNSGADGANARWTFIINNNYNSDTAQIKHYHTWSTYEDDGPAVYDPESTTEIFNYDRGVWEWVHVIFRVSLNSGSNDDFVQVFINGVCVSTMDTWDGAGIDFTSADIDEIEWTFFESNTTNADLYLWFDQSYILDPGAYGKLKTTTDKYTKGEKIYWWPGLNPATGLTYEIE